MHSAVCTVIDLFMCVCHILLINYYYDCDASWKIVHVHFQAVVACTECYQAVCYDEVMHYIVRLLELDPTKWFLRRDAVYAERGNATSVRLSVHQ